MSTRCGLIEIDNQRAKWVECSFPARWISPSRLHTEGTLMVCDKCKGIMKSEYLKSGRVVEFAPMSLIKKK